jgi:hypothetical protein
MFAIGLYPEPWFDLLGRPAAQLVKHIYSAGAPVAAQLLR